MSVVKERNGYCVVASMEKYIYDMPDFFLGDTFRGRRLDTVDAMLKHAVETREIILSIESEYHGEFRSEWNTYPIDGKRSTQLAWLKRHGYRIVRAKVSIGHE